MTSDNTIWKIRNAAKYTFIFKILSQGSGFIATVLIVRALSEHEFGIYNILYSIIAFIGMIASFGIGNTLQRYIPEYYQKGEFKIAHNLFRAASLIRLLCNIIIFALILLLWDTIAPTLKIEAYRNYFLIFTLIICLHMQRGILETCLGAYFLHGYSKAIGFIFPIIKALGYALIIFFEQNLWYAISVDILAYLIVFLALQIIYFNKIPHNEGLLERFGSQEKKRLYRYSIFYNFNDAGSGLLHSDFDNFILVIFLNPVAVGAYSFCNKITKQLENLLPLNYFLEVLRPAYFTIGNSPDKDQNIFFQSLIKLNCLFTIPLFFFLTIYSTDCISFFFGGKFIEYANVLSAIFFFSVLSSFKIPLGLVAQFLEKADIILYSKAFAIYNIIADIILIKLFGIWGAVIATGTANLGKNLFIWYFIRNKINFKGIEYFLGKILFFWLIISGVLFLIKTMLNLDVFITLLSGIFLFVVAFWLQFRLDYFNSIEKEIFRKMLGNNSKITVLRNILLNEKPSFQDSPKNNTIRK